MANTPNLGIRLIEAADIVNHEQINDMFRTVDAAIADIGVPDGVTYVITTFSTTLYASGWQLVNNRWTYILENATITTDTDVEIFLSEQQTGLQPILDQCFPRSGNVKLLASRQIEENLDVVVRVKGVQV